MAVILGLNAFHAGSSSAIVVDGEPVIAISEERLNRVKYYAAFPRLAIRRCLEITGLNFQDIDAVAIGRDSSANLSRKAEYALRNPSRLLNLLKIKASRVPLDDLKALIAQECEVGAGELRFKQYNVEHHLSHLASAYFISPWDRAAGFSLDGSGDFVTSMMAECEGSEIKIKKRIYVPHSLGSLYTMVSEFIGYRSYGDEGKMMGLSALGEDTYHDHFEDMLILKPEDLRLNAKYFLSFGSNQGLSIDEKGQMVIDRHYSDYVCQLFGPPREPDGRLEKRDLALAFGVQRIFEKGYFHLLNMLHGMVPLDNVVMAGGCALNSVANGKVFDGSPFRKTCIQPAAGDEGLALGAALYVSNSMLREGRRYVMKDAYLGPEYSEAEIRSELDRNDVPYIRCERESLLKRTAKEIAKGRVVGWFQGRMEWGPRALGNRSILVHPGQAELKDILNARIKRREWFRPFAPSVLAEAQERLFEKAHPSPFMLHVYRIRPEWRQRLSAVNHVDDTGRLQSVAREENPLYYDLIKAFEKETGIPALLNTSFNENEPIVCSPADAISCYLRTKMDALAIGPFFCIERE